MKRIFLPILLLTVSSFLLSSCFKNTGIAGELDDAPVQKVVEIFDANQTDGFTLYQLDVNPPIQDFDLVQVKVNSKTPLTSDVQVTLRLDNTAIADYNSNNGTNYVELPANAYVIDNYTVTVDKATGIGYLKLRLAKNLLNLANSYAIGFTIASTSDGVISQNVRTAVYAFVVKNKYDGVYSWRMRLDGWSAYGISDGVAGTYPLEFDLITAGAGSVTIDAGPPFYDLQPGFTGGVGFISAATAFGATTPKFTFNTATDALVSVVNTTPDDGRGRTLYIDPAVTTSRYDPVTKKMYLAYVMTQNGRPNQLIKDTLTYLRPR